MFGVVLKDVDVGSSIIFSHSTSDSNGTQLQANLGNTTKYPSMRGFETGGHWREDWGTNIAAPATSAEVGTVDLTGGANNQVNIRVDGVEKAGTSGQVGAGGHNPLTITAFPNAPLRLGTLWWEGGSFLDGRFYGGGMTPQISSLISSTSDELMKQVSGLNF